MFDNIQNSRPADCFRVNVNETEERSYWCMRYGCTAAQLRAAVSAVGVMATDVEALLAKHIPPRRVLAGFAGK